MGQIAKLSSEAGWDQKPVTDVSSDWVADKIYAIALRSEVVISSLVSSKRAIVVSFEEEELPMELVRELTKLEKDTKQIIQVAGQARGWRS